MFEKELVLSRVAATGSAVTFKFLLKFISDLSPPSLQAGTICFEVVQSAEDLCGLAPGESIVLRAPHIPLLMSADRLIFTRVAGAPVGNGQLARYTVELTDVTVVGVSVGNLEAPATVPSVALTNGASPGEEETVMRRSFYPNTKYYHFSEDGTPGHDYGDRKWWLSLLGKDEGDKECPIDCGAAPPTNIQ